MPVFSLLRSAILSALGRWSMCCSDLQVVDAVSEGANVSGHWVATVTGDCESELL